MSSLVSSSLSDLRRFEISLLSSLFSSFLDDIQTTDRQNLLLYAGLGDAGLGLGADAWGSRGSAYLVALGRHLF